MGLCLSDGANREGTDISPKYQSRHSKFWLNSFPEIIFSDGARSKPGSTTAKLSELGPTSLDYILVQVRMCSLGEVFFFFFKYSQKAILEALYKSNTPIHLHFIHKPEAAGFLNGPASQHNTHEHMRSARRSSRNNDL